MTFCTTLLALYPQIIKRTPLFFPSFPKWIHIPNWVWIHIPIWVWIRIPNWVSALGKLAFNRISFSFQSTADILGDVLALDWRTYGALYPQIIKRTPLFFPSFPKWIYTQLGMDSYSFMYPFVYGFIYPSGYRL